MRKSVLALFLPAALALAAPLAAQQFSPALYAGMRWRQIGPFRGGRVSAVAGIAGDASTYYMGSPGGGLWKTTSGGEVWTPIFDAEPTESIGAIAIAASDPRIIYVGTGDVSNVGGSVNQGDGVYKSVDGGATWQHMGLPDSRHIGAIVVDPHDPNLVLVAALGHTFARNEERGVFRSADGGRNWSKVLYRGDDIGAIHVTADPDDPKVLYAAMERHYTPAGGGRGGRGAAGPPAGGDAPAALPSSTIYRSADEGLTWTPLTGHGLPDGEVGKIGIAVAQGTHGLRLYAVNSVGVFRSDDGGANWTQSTTDSRVKGSAYFGEIYVAPDNPNVVYVVHTVLYRSTDGGHTFSAFKGAPGGDDTHVMWIDPANARRMIMGVDQGATVSLDAGQTWSLWYNQPNGQFYHLAVDNRFPYWVYGTQQDSGSAAESSRGDFGELTFMDWIPSVGAYESGYITPDPLDPNFIFATSSGGHINRYNAVTKQIFDITPPPSGGYRIGAGPQAFSPQDGHVFYLGAQSVLETRDRGLNWKAISPDLAQPPGGAEAAVPAAGRGGGGRGGRGGTISALAPSPARAGVFWAGTSNGLVQLSTDGGASWRAVTPPGLPAGAAIEQIEASPADPATAYVALEHHTANDFAPYIFRTRDSGASWTQVGAGLPAGDFVRAVAEDPGRAGLLYAGTEHGIFVSFNGGDAWQSLQLNLPPGSVRDLVVHRDDLVVATFGRAFWILDDLAPLRQLAPQVAAAPAYLFHPEETIRAQPDVNYDTPFPPEMPTGTNPPAGAILDYALKAAPSGPITLGIYDAAGQLVRELTSAPPPPEPEPKLDIPNYWLARPEPLPAAAGMNRAVWDLRYTPPPALRHEYPISALWHDTPADPRGPFVTPGDYEVRLTVGGRTYQQPLRVTMDPRVTTSPAGLAAQRDLGLKISAAMAASFAASQQVAAARAALGGGADPAALAQLAALGGGSGGGGRGGRGGASFATINGQLGTLMSAVELADEAPTQAMVELFQAPCQALGAALGEWERLRASLTGLPPLPALPKAPACEP